MEVFLRQPQLPLHYFLLCEHSDALFTQQAVELKSRRFKDEDSARKTKSGKAHRWPKKYRKIWEEKGFVQVTQMQPVGERIAERWPMTRRERSVLNFALKTAGEETMCPGTLTIVDVSQSMGRAPLGIN